MITFLFKHKDDKFWVEYYENGKLIGISENGSFSQSNKIEVEYDISSLYPKNFKPTKNFSLSVAGDFKYSS